MPTRIEVTKQVYPFVKWADGKRQLLGEIRARMPENFTRYYEPFVGGGAVFLNLAPEKALINDINTSLINAYLQIRDNPHDVILALNELDEGHSRREDGRAYYYDARERYNALIDSSLYDMSTAALFIYINKHCFNGLYRVNAAGRFNVSYNGSKQPSYTRENILSLSEVLAKATITNLDFEIACMGATKGDFVFLDSPYAPLNPTSFESYTKEGFSQSDHERLAQLFCALSQRGCYCMLTNHDTPLIRRLYSDFRIDVVTVRRSINSNASNRTGTEVIVTSY